MTDKYDIQVVKRSWYEWLLWALWFVVELFILQSATSSSGELEPRAASIFWVTFFVLLVGGAVVYYLRRNAK